jgi:hypothetical protein
MVWSHQARTELISLHNRLVSVPRKPQVQSSHHYEKLQKQIECAEPKV